MRDSITISELLSNEAVFEVARVIALTDSIGEGYGYCKEYTMEEYLNPSHDEMKEYQQVAIEAVGRLLEAIIGHKLVQTTVEKYIDEKIANKGLRAPKNLTINGT